MTTLEEHHSTEAVPDSGALVALVGDRLTALLPPGVVAGLDVAVLGLPGQEHRTAFGALPPTVTIRLYAATVVIAATPTGAGPCPQCLDRRWVVCRPTIERRILDNPHGVLSTVPSLPGPHALSVAAALCIAAVESAPEGPAYPVWELDARTARVERFALIRDSSCDCAAPPADTAEGARIRLRSTLASSPGSGRSRRPEDLNLPMDALANPVCGMLGGPAMRAYHATATAPASGHFEVRSKYGLHEMWWSGHAESYQRSELLGAMEGLERDAGQRPRRVTPALRASVTELTAPYVEMEQCGLYPPDFYVQHEAKYVPWASNPSVPWVWGWSVRDHRPLLVPEQIAYYLDHREDHRNTVQECSNGCASGSSVTEAVLHGQLELIERDAFLISWYSGLTPTEIDLDTVDSPLVRQMRAHVDLLGYDLRCFDIRVDLPVPAVGAVAVRRDGGIGTLCFAGGASLDPADAVRAAVCEVASYVTGFADRVTDTLGEVQRMVEDYGNVTELAHHALLFGMPAMAQYADHWLRQTEVTPLADVYADWTTGRAPATDLREPVEEIVALFAARGMDTVVVDQTTPEQLAMELHTVATIVPGLIPIDFGWQRQRVLTMPRTLWAAYQGGRATQPLSADQLHRVPHPFP
ncbi:TOMM precursor leader peptide-binding protein [Kribbella sp. CA-294648]|uniref:TOMM precursor leader peptide-binding protein n=1 Tax=Kribbella sp. CA-294648 TaxID=3239948 RepID=UPI003D93EC7A